MAKCPKCQSEKSTKERFTWNVTHEIIDFEKCTNCGSIIDVDIERPIGMTLKNVRSSSEIRFSENEKRNLAFLLLQALETQNKILAAIATKTVPDGIEKILETRTTGRQEFMTLLEIDDLDYGGDRS